MKNGIRMLLLLAALYALVSIPAHAFVEAKVDNAKPVYGDEVTLTLRAKGEKVRFPDITDIAGFRIESTGTSQNIQSINGRQSVSLSKVMTFRPLKNVTIPSFSILVDGKTENTDPIPITLTQPTQTTDPDFTLTIKANKETAYIGEQVDFTLLFQRHKSKEIMELQYSASPYEHFWIKQNGKERTYTSGDYVVHELRYLGFPQKEGSVSVSPARMRVGVPKQNKDIFGFWIKQPSWKNVISNKLEFTIQPVPGNVPLTGEFTIALSVDREETEINEPVNVTLTVTGKGNMDDIPDFELDVPGVTVYADNPEKKYGINAGDYGGEYKRTFAIVADQNYVIPPLSINYFDLNTQTVKTRKTEVINISVLGAAPEEKKVILEKKEPESGQTESEPVPAQTMGTNQILLYFGAGIFAGIALLLLFQKLTGNTRSESTRNREDLVSQIKKAKTDKDLLGVLLPLHERHETFREAVSQLEANLYGAYSKIQIDRKKIIQTAKALDSPAEEDEA